MGSTLTTMFSATLSGAWCLMLSGVAFKVLIGKSTPNKSILNWLTTSKSRWSTRMPGIFNRLSFSVSPFLRILERTWRRKVPDTVMTPEMERRYWRRSAKDRVALQRSDARFVGEKTGRSTRVPADLPPLVIYYTPALPPLRHKKRVQKGGDLFYISAKNYCKWYRMVFPGKKPPTISEAARLRSDHDSDEQKEMYRISRMLPDDEVFPRSGVQRRPLSSKYQKKWKKWLASRPGGDIVFGETSLDDSTPNNTRQEPNSKPERIQKLKLPTFGQLRAKDPDGGYDVKEILTILIKALN